MPTIRNRNMIFTKTNDDYPEEDRVFRLPRIATASLPPAAQYEGCLVYDATEDIVKYSNASNWVNLPSAS